MSVANLVDKLADATGVSKTQIKAVLAALPDAVIEQVKESDKDSATIPGIGIVKLVTRKARLSKNPRTGEPLQVPERIVPSIKPGKAFKDKF
jgi:nucleoid DNA-binding protein